MIHTILMSFIKWVFTVSAKHLLGLYKIPSKIRWLLTKDKSSKKFIDIFFKTDKYKFQNMGCANKWIAKIEQNELERTLKSASRIVNYRIHGKTINATNESGVFFEFEFI